MTRALDRLRAQAVRSSLAAPTTLARAIERLGFVQADPIRAPARAQDLILRHRVDGYRAGDLERGYPELGIEEDVLYAYGFVARAVWRDLHPRRASRLSALERRILERVRADGPTHPRELDAAFGTGRVVNAWGGSSKETTAALERLHWRGLLRVARRDRGVRVYEAATPVDEPASPRERLRRLALAAAKILAPVAERTLHTITAWMRRGLPAVDHRVAVRELIRSGELEREVVDGEAYLWPASSPVPAAGEAPPRVRFLAPFDPVVWDRRRFEQLWGWAYRFEAYTPVAKRVRGYYAMPLLFGDRVIGWANAAVDERDALRVDVGFASRRPAGRDFARELDAEIARLARFLAVAPPR